MGIKGLTTFIKAKYPSVIKQYPARWADPAIRGKRIALDGTLITTRMFKVAADGEMEPKRVVVGWHALLTKMLRYHIKPVVVYDERGEREWKQVEADRRYTERTKHLSRALHEEQRQTRYQSIQDVIHEISTLREGERVGLGEELRAMRLPSLVGSLEDPYAVDLASGSSNSVVPISPLSERVAGIVVEHLMHHKPYQPSKGRLSQAQAFTQAEEAIFNTSESDDSSISSSPAEDTPVPPSLEYTESPRQTLLSLDEAEVIQSLLDSLTHPSNHNDTSNLASDLSSTISDFEIRSQVLGASYDRGHSTPSEEDHAEAKELILAMGIPIIIARIPYEAEGVASSMARAGMVDFAGSEDSDILGYEAPCLRGMTVQNKPLEVMRGSEVREALEMDEKTYLDFITLLGNDAINRIPNIGPVKALKYLRKYGSIEGILAAEPELAVLVGPEYMDRVQISRNMFGIMPPLPTMEELEIRPVKKEEVMAFLKERHGIEMESVEEEEVGQSSREMEDDARSAEWEEGKGEMEEAPPRGWDEVDGSEEVAEMEQGRKME